MHPVLATTNATDQYSPTSIERLESLLGARLPESYRQFLVETNGGVPWKKLLRFYNEVDEEEQESAMQCFYALDDPRSPERRRRPFEDRVEHVYENIMQTNLPDRRLVPIGQDVAGNIICLSLEPDTAGQIMFYDHDYDEVYALTSNFELFVGQLENEAPE